MIDQFGRKINYLRISVTDRCNLRCRYCMPPEGIQLTEMADILSYEEILRVCRAAAALGIDAIKLTGGEPLVRKGLVSLVRQIKTIDGIHSVTLTTNGILLGPMARELKEAGLDAVNISLDTLDREKYRELTGFDGLDLVLAAVDAALGAGLRCKINTVLLEDTDLAALCELAGDRQLDVRFIEMMPIGLGRKMRPMPGSVFLEQLYELYPQARQDLEPRGNGPARYFAVPGFRGEIGFIHAMHDRFCGECNRMRLTSMGMLKPCLCYSEGYDLCSILRQQAQDRNQSGSRRSCMEKDIDEALRCVFLEAAAHKPGQHCFEKQEDISEKHNMVSIGG